MIAYFFCSSRRRHTRCALVTGVQTCARPIYPKRRGRGRPNSPLFFSRKRGANLRRHVPAILVVLPQHDETHLAAAYLGGPAADIVFLAVIIIDAPLG